MSRRAARQALLRLDVDTEPRSREEVVEHTVAATEIRRAAVGECEVRVLVSTSARGAGDARARIHRAAEESRGGLEV